MLEHAEEIMVGVSILMKAVKVNKAFIGIENNKPDAIQLMTKVASSYAGIEVVPLKVQYPQGGEKQLIDAVISRQVAAGALLSPRELWCRMWVPHLPFTSRTEEQTSV